MSLFGTEKVKEGCESIGVKVDQLPEKITGVESFRKIASIDLDEHGENLLRALLEINPKKRIDVNTALRHEFFAPIRSGKKRA